MPANGGGGGAAADSSSEKQQKRQHHDEDADPIASLIGNYGKWQLKMTFLLSLCSFPCTFHIFSPSFIGGTMDFWCARPDAVASMDPHEWRRVSQSEDGCSIYDVDWSRLNSTNPQIPPNAHLVACTAWEFDRKTTFSSTIISEWLLVCERAYLNTVADVLFLAGIAVGGVVSGMISDRFGRKKTLIFSVTVQTVLALSICVCPWFELYLVLRITLGFFSVSVVFSGFVLVVELVGGRWRTIAGVCNFFPLPVSYIIVSLVSMALPDWRMLQLALSIPGGLLIFLWWIVPESPHWLLSVGRVDEVRAIVRSACEYNGRPLPKNLDGALRAASASSRDVDERRASVVDLLRGETLRITALVFAMWFGTTLVYYGLVLNITTFGGDLYATSILAGVVELPALALSVPTLLRTGRRSPVALSLAVAGGGCLAASAARGEWLRIALVMLSKFCVGATNGALPTYTAELYPTLMRNMGVGASQVSAGVALVSIPYLWTLGFVMENFPMMIMGIAGILSGFCVLLLPETANKSLTTIHTNVEAPEAAINQNGPTTVEKT